MIKDKVNVILDAQWGSSGKGKFATWLADKHKSQAASTSNGPNAGHTVEYGEHRVVFKALPAALAAPSVSYGLITGAAVFSPDQVNNEVLALRKFKGKTFDISFHDRAAVLSASHKISEEASPTLAHLSSTRQGTAAAMTDKIMRDPLVTIGSQCRSLVSKLALTATIVTPDQFRNQVAWHLSMRHTLIHEVAQGFALSIDYGHSYPYCTSRNCTVSKALDDLGMPPAALGDVYLNMRPYPIRVGNLEDNYSGDTYWDSEETFWDTIALMSGMSKEEAEKLKSRELTTVTKRLRRVFTFSPYGFKCACEVNAPTKLIVNFVQYLDWELAGATGAYALHQLPRKIRDFCELVQSIANAPVVALGTGPGHHEVIEVLG